MDLQGVPTPTIDFDATNLPEEWRKFKQHVELVFKGPMLDKDDSVKATYILLWVGAKGRDIFNTWQLSEDDSKKLDILYTRFKGYCEPKLNPLFARFKFNHEIQGNSTLEEFVTRIKLSARDCNYKDPEEMIRDRIVFGINADQVRERLLNEGESLTLDKTIQIAQSFEYTRQQMKQMVHFDKPRELNVNMINQGGAKQKVWKQKQNRTNNFVPKAKTDRAKSDGAKSYGAKNNTNCGRCGRLHTKNNCPAYGKQCLKCKGWGHFAFKCKSLNVNEVHKVSATHPDEYHTDDNFLDHDFFVDSIETTENQDQAFVTLSVRSIPVKFKIDTGSQVNIVPKSVFQQINYIGPLKAPERHLFAYSGSTLDTLGQCDLECCYKSKKHLLDCYVVDTTSTPVIGLNSCLKLGLVQLTYSVDTTNRQNETRQTLNKTDVLEKFSDVFDGIGQFEGECTIHIDPNVQPVIHAPRKVAISLRSRFKDELDRMEQSEIIEPVSTPTEWVNSIVIVEKPQTGKLRICLDPKDLNKAIKRPHYPMRTLDDILPQLSGAKYFSKLDARSGYWAIKLSDKSSYLTTFHTPFGRYRFLRLPFGIKSAQDEFQKKVDMTYEGLSGVAAIVDDILVFGKTAEEHDENLRKVLQRTREKGIKLNAEKVEIGMSEIHYFGHILSSDGLKPDPGKIEAIREMEAPRNKNELQTILGMVNYLARFAPNLSSLTSPMRQLLARDVEFAWDKPQSEAFSKIKEVITEAPMLSYYDPDAELTLQVDASQFGLGATLMQNGRPVAYASKSLTPSEIQYAQIEKEVFAILFGCKRFHQFIYGRHVLVESDHKPIMFIARKSLHVAPVRIQRMLLQLQQYDLEIQYRAGKEIPVADTLSRKFLPDTFEELSDGVNVHVHTIMSAIPVSDRKLDEIKAFTESESQFEVLADTIHNGWPDDRKDCPPVILDYWNFRDELSVINHVIMKGSRIVIPKGMRQTLLNSIHSGHMGIEKCQTRARDIMYWPNMSNDIKEMVLKCTICLERRNANAKEPLQQHDIPDRPWKAVATDLFTWNNADYIVVVDYFSRYFEVGKLTNTKSLTVITKMKSIMARHGVPETVMSDGGPQYTSQDFADFARDWDFVHKTSSPHYPQSNGLAERTVQTVKRIFSKAKADGKDPYIGIMEYRTTALECGSSPSQLLMGRQLRSVLPCTNEHLTPKTVDIKQVQMKMSDNRKRQKRRYDATAKPLQTLSTGETVRMKHNDRLWKPATVTKRHSDRSYIVQAHNGGTYRRNRRHLLSSGPTSYFRFQNFDQPKVAPHPEPTHFNNTHVGNRNSLAPDHQNTNTHVQLPKPPDPTPPAVRNTNSSYTTRSGRVVKPVVPYSM